MLYALLIYEADSVSLGYSDEDLEEALRGHRELQEDAKRRGVFVEANQLVPPHGATSVRVRCTKPHVTDGPFIETKELLIGYYILDCTSVDEAIEFASRIPHARTGGVEVRPVEYFERDATAQRTWTKSL